MDFMWIDNGIIVPKKVQPVEKGIRILKNKQEFESFAPDTGHDKLTTQIAQKSYKNASQSQPNQRQPLQAKQIMSSPVTTLSMDATIEEAWKLTHSQKFKHIPVISKDKKVVGIISDRDLLRLSAEADCLFFPLKESNELLQNKSVKDIMKTKVLTAKPETEVRKIARVLFEEKIGSMPVVDDKEHLVGIITRNDILRVIVYHTPIESFI